MSLAADPADLVDSADLTDSPGPAAPAPAPGLPVGVEVEVQVLGPVQVRGAARAFARAWTLELVAYLAVHPRGASTGEWATALWPDQVMAPATLYSVASAARRALGGSAGSGGDHLPRAHGRLQLAPTVGTDWQRLRHLASADDPLQWRAGLSLVRGQPLEGLRPSEWPVCSGTVAAIEEDVVCLGEQLGEHCLAAGDPRTARWAARRALLASPYEERLFRILLRAADALGSTGEMDAVLAELVARLGGVPLSAGGGRWPGRRDFGAALQVVHPRTVALYEALSRRQMRPASGVGPPGCRVSTRNGQR